MALETLQNGRYHSSRLLGRGGMGEVYLMQDQRVNRQVAIKIIRNENVSYPEGETALNAARLFQREAKAIAALDHPNILPLYDFGEETSDDTTLSYMVMPFCAEGSLANWLRIHGPAPFPPRDVAYFIEQAAEALQYAHEHGVIHLDVKPQNFLLRSNKKNPDRPTILLADFGVARNSTTVSNSSRTIRGTPTAMAPEQWSSMPVPATDQYALAVMAFEMLSGRPPFVGSMEQLMYQHFTAQPPAPSSINSNIPAALDAVILRALAKKPEDRFPSIAAFADAFEQAVSHSSTASTFQRVGNDLSGRLTISKQEAETGISRRITLPGGQQILVAVPAGVQDGQVIRVPEPDGSPTQPAGTVLLSIDVKQSYDTQPVAEPGSVDPVQPVTPASTNLADKTVSAEKTQSATPALSIGNGTDAERAQPATPSVQKSIGHDLPTVATDAQGRTIQSQQPASAPKGSSVQRLGVIGIVSVLVIALLLLGVLLIGHPFQQKSPQAAGVATGSTSTAASAQPKGTPTVAATPTPKIQNGLYIPGTYRGSTQDNTTGQSSPITVFLAQQKGNGALSGSVTFTSPNQTVDPLSGSVDLQGNFSFTVQQPNGQKPLYFFGTVLKQSDGNYLKGQYCSSTTSSCISLTGIFYVGPGY
jgi:eukaryotic-like serine/threonine-protein kinase